MTQQQLFKMLHKLIEEKGTQKEVAAYLGVSPAYFSDVLAGRRSPGPKVLEKLGLEARMTYVEKAS